MTLGATIGEILPLAVGVALFPIPAIAVLLLLSTQHARANGIGFAAGWMIGVAAAITTVALLTDTASADMDLDTSAFVTWLKLLLGVGLLLLSLRQWRGRPSPGEDPQMPGWMKRIDGFSAGKAFRTGVMLSAANPKNIAIMVAAGGAIAQNALGFAHMAIALGLFTSVASVTTAGPVLYYLLGGERAMLVMDGAKRWMIQNSTTIMCVLLMILGVILVGNGIRGLSGSHWGAATHEISLQIWKRST